MTGVQTCALRSPAPTKAGDAPGEGDKPYGDVTYADPGYQDDKKKRYPLDTEEHVRAAASYFGRPRNRKKYSKDQQEKIDSKIDAAKKKFKIGAYSEKMAEIGLYKCCDGPIAQYSPADGVSLTDYSVQPGPGYIYLPRTFGDVWEDVENVEVFPEMGKMLGRTIANILSTRGLSGAHQAELIQASFDEFMEEIQDELMEADENAAELATAIQKLNSPQLVKSGARNSAADMKHIQAMHDSAVALGAECAPKEEKSAQADIDGIIKALAPLKEFGSTQLIVMTQEQVEKLATGTPLEKVMEAVNAKASEVQTNLEAKLSLTDGEVAKVAAITSKHEGTIADVGKRLEVVEKQPATVTLPVSRPTLGMQNSSAADALDTNEIALVDLNKQYDSAPDGILKSQLGMQIAQLQIKVAQHKAAMR